MAVTAIIQRSYSVTSFFGMSSMKFLLSFFVIGLVMGCHHNGTSYQHLDEWKDENFKLQCIIDVNGNLRSRVTSCITPSGDTVDINSKVQIGNTLWECYINWRMKVGLKKKILDGCEHEGTFHKHGEHWDNKNKTLKYSCGIGHNNEYVIEVLSCITPTGLYIPVNTSVFDDKYNEWECYVNSPNIPSLRAPLYKQENCIKGNAYGTQWHETPTHSYLNSYKVVFSFQCIVGGQTKYLGCPQPTLPKHDPTGLNKTNYQCTWSPPRSPILLILYAVPQAFNDCKFGKEKHRIQTGTKWIEGGQLEKMCYPFGEIFVTGCKFSDLDEIVLVNESKIKGGTNYTCEERHGEVSGEVAYMHYSLLRTPYKKEDKLNDTALLY